jgi:putative flavoprotein involved in K+ transport
VQYKGVAASAPGLYFVGLPFLHSFASMLVAGAGRDAGRVARHIATERARELQGGTKAVALAVAS